MQLLRKISDPQIPLPVLRIEDIQNSAKGAQLQNLADYLDVRRTEAQREFQHVYV